MSRLPVMMPPCVRLIVVGVRVTNSCSKLSLFITTKKGILYSIALLVTSCCGHDWLATGTVPSALVPKGGHIGKYDTPVVSCGGPAAERSDWLIRTIIS